MNFNLILLVILSTVIVGCSTKFLGASKTQKEKKLVTVAEVLGGESKNIIVIERNLSSKELQSIVSHPEITSIRLIRLTRPAGIELLPEYRLLDITKDGPYAKLGFEPGDIIIGCHGFILDSPIQFFRYVKSLHLLDNPSFDVIRRNKHLKIQIVKLPDDT